eukprot:TRINITY_DN3619_c0_g1_i1.p2 TRINITY_DN3619_c0_g1~~TRINITY_DN3619_c0_g1_i1.p2  ORF type:complete len:242 (-),score=16.73 TRINITY_DN3619_c0_g1_i1:3-728(-)
MHDEGYVWSTYVSGMYVDGHEREDVVRYREGFVKAILEVLNSCFRGESPSVSKVQTMTGDSSKAADDTPLGASEPEQVWVTHDETVCKANDDNQFFWLPIGETKLKKKSEGASIMISAFGTENGLLKVPADKAETFKAKHGPTVQMEAVFSMEIGKSKEGYYTNDKFLPHVENAINIFEAEHPGKQGVFMFDQAALHKRMSSNALNASVMNVGPGGKQPVSRSSTWNGRVQHTTREPSGFR